MEGAIRSKQNVSGDGHLEPRRCHPLLTSRSLDKKRILSPSDWGPYTHVNHHSSSFARSFTLAVRECSQNIRLDVTRPLVAMPKLCHHKCATQATHSSQSHFLATP